MNQKLQNAINRAEEREYQDNHLSDEEKRALVNWFASDMSEVGVLDPELASLDEQYWHIIHAYSEFANSP